MAENVIDLPRVARFVLIVSVVSLITAGFIFLSTQSSKGVCQEIVSEQNLSDPKWLEAEPNLLRQETYDLALVGSKGDTSAYAVTTKDTGQPEGYICLLFKEVDQE
jgi:hypothetical protein